MTEPDIQETEAQNAIERLNLNSNDLDETRRPSIENALSSYRATVLHQNLTIRRMLVNAAGSAVVNNCDTAAEAQEARVRLFDWYQVHLEGKEISSSSELLRDNVRDLLMASSNLYGVDHYAHDVAARTFWLETTWASSFNTAQKLCLLASPLTFSTLLP